MSTSDGARVPKQMYLPFRPRAARIVCLVLAVLVVAMMSSIAILLPSAGSGSPGGTTMPDRIGVAGFGVLVAWFLLRQAGVRADPDPDGVTVRNLLLTRRVTWAQIVSVRFGQGRAWVQLDLADGDTLAVMGIQAADGVRAEVEARRMANLVALHSATPADD